MDYTVTDSKGSTLPTKIYLLDVRLSNRITLVATTADDKDSSISVSEEQMTAKAPLSAHLEAMQANRPNIKVLAGVNADFFHIRTNQMPCGVIYRNGRCIKGSYDDQTTVFALLADGTARCMSATEYELLDKSLIREAVSGRQMLLNNGVQQSRSTRLEPRTAVGVTRDGKRLFILVADGRRKEYSNGLSYADMAATASMSIPYTFAAFILAARIANIAVPQPISITTLSLTASSFWRSARHIIYVVW